jgi:hypothetical protein
MIEIKSNNDRNIVKKVMSKLFVGILIASVLIGMLAVIPEEVRAETWSIETVDSDDEVGHDTSIALDRNGYPHISYRDHTNKDLKYARWNGRTWNIETVDSGDYVVMYTSSIALDSDDRPHISYLDVTHGNLMCARWTGDDWDIETVDSAYKVGSYTSIALDSNDYPHISYYDYGNGNLMYARWDGRTWDNETVDSEGVVGLSTSIALDSKGHPHISYRDHTNKDLKYARWNGRTWNIETVDSEGVVGYATSIALDSKGHPHISYRDYTDDYLKYTRWTGDDWDIETVEYVGDVDFSTSIALDSNDYPHISYLDYINDNLKYARWTGDDWDIETVDSDYKVGSYPSIALDSNDYPHISYRDYTSGDLKYAKLAATVPTPPRNLNVSAGDGCVRLSWDAPDDDGATITNYSIYRGTTPGGEQFLKEVGNVLTYADDDVTNEQTYYYQVSAENSIGKGERSDEKCVTLITVPSAPLNFRVTPGDGNVNLEWAEPSDYGGSPITNYKLYRGTVQGEETLLRPVGNVLTYTDDNVIDNLTYYYQVSAKNSAGEGDMSDEKFATLIPDTTVPSAPQDLEATPGDGHVSLEWLPAREDGGKTITNYNLYRGTVQGEETLLRPVGNVLSYTDDDVFNDQTYYYQVSAENSAGDGERSKEISVTQTDDTTDDTTDMGLWITIIVALIGTLGVIAAALINYLSSKKTK